MKSNLLTYSGRRLKKKSKTMNEGVLVYVCACGPVYAPPGYWLGWVEGKFYEIDFDMK